MPANNVGRIYPADPFPAKIRGGINPRPTLWPLFNGLGVSPMFAPRYLIGAPTKSSNRRAILVVKVCGRCARAGLAGVPANATEYRCHGQAARATGWVRTAI